MINRSSEPLLLPEAEGEASVGSIWEASQDITMTLTESFMQSEARDTASKIGKKLTPEEANKRFPGLQADREISEGEAQYLYDWKKEKAEKQKIINSASDSFLKGTALPFVAGAADSLTDPAEVAIGLATGGIGTGLKVGASLGKKIAIDFFEAGLSQTIAEAPIMMETNQSFEEYTSKQFAQNALMASVLQIGVQYGGSAAFKNTAKALKYAGEKTSENLYKLQRSLEKEGVNSTGVMNQLMEEIDAEYSNTGKIRESVNRNFPEIDLEKAENFEDVMKIVDERYKAGDITDEAMDAFARDAFENGVNPQMMKRFVEDSPYEFSDDLVELTKREANDPKNTIGYEDRFNQEIDELEGQTIESLDQDIMKSFEESFENLSEEVLEDTIDVGNNKTMKIAEYREQIRQSKESQQYLNEYAACVMGGSGNVPM